MEVKQISWNDSHYYEVSLPNGKKEFFPSVTTKLSAVSSPYLAKWRGDIGNEVADRKLVESQIKGSNIHKAFETYVKGDYVHIALEDVESEIVYQGYVIRDFEQALAFHRLVRFVEETNPVIHESESVVYSEKYMEAGTTDGVIEIEEGTYQINGSKPLDLPKGKYCIDIKSGKSVSETAYLQVSAYTHFMEEMGTHKDIVGALILHTASANRRGIEGLGVHYIPRSDMDYHYSVYRNVAYVWNWQNKNSTTFKPKVYNLPKSFKR